MLAEIAELNAEFSKRFGLKDLSLAPQGSQDWFEMKLGVISASSAHEVIAGKKTATRQTYMAELVAQVCTGHYEELNSKYLDWGNQHEDAARALYEFQNDVKVQELPFVFKDNGFRAGCSPDALVNDKKGMEIKCPYNSQHYIQFLAADTVKTEYIKQVQFTMWVLNAGEWDMVQYDPRMPKNMIHTLTIPRDEEMMKAFDDLIPDFVADMDLMLKKTGISFGDQWKRIAEREKSEGAA